jgi:hypothetical protein
MVPENNDLRAALRQLPAQPPSAVAARAGRWTRPPPRASIRPMRPSRTLALTLGLWLSATIVACGDDEQRADDGDDSGAQYCETTGQHGQWPSLNASMLDFLERFTLAAMP